MISDFTFFFFFNFLHYLIVLFNRFNSYVESKIKVVKSCRAYAHH